MFPTEKPKVFKAVFLSIVFTVLFLVLLSIAVRIVTAVLIFLLELPVLSWLIALSPARDDPNNFIITAAAGFVGFPMMALLEMIIPHRPTYGLTCKLAGIFLCIIYTLSFIIWLINGYFMWSCIVMFGFGLIVYSAGKDN